MSTLKVISGPATGLTVELDGEIVIGRESADLTIPDPQLSRRHFAVRRKANGVEVEDLGSTNGTFVDGRRISGRTLLTGAATVRAGGSEITIDAAPVPPVAAPPALASQAAAAAPVAPAAGSEVESKRPGLAELITMGLTVVVSVVVLVVLFAASPSKDITLASNVDIAPPSPTPVPRLTHFGAGQAFRLGESSYVVQASARATGGAFTVMRIDLRSGSEPPPHIHHREDEAFYLFHGTMIFKVGETLLQAGPGDLVFLPRGAAHGYQVTSGRADVLLLAVPGGLDEFFAVLARDPALGREVARRYGIQPATGPGAPPAGKPAPGSSQDRVLAPFVRRAGQGERVKLRGSLYTIKADTRDTGRRFALLQIDLHRGSEPPPHIHHNEAEIFFLLSGTMTFFSEGKALRARSGDLMFLPRGLQHSYRVTSGVAHVLLLAVPPGLEQFFKLFSKHPKLVRQLGTKFGIQPGAARVGPGS